jgi:hypothetical protein
MFAALIAALIDERGDRVDASWDADIRCSLNGQDAPPAI